jgi:MoaA/NifB/PqqE/SkfB family radical SAM enzyme
MICTTCSFPDLATDERKHVALKDAKYAIDFLSRNGVRMISITGGEPLLHPNFIDICEYISKKRIMISYISTGGNLLTEQIAKRLSLMNVNIVGISIDVLDEKGLGITRKVNIQHHAPKARKILAKYKIETYAGIVLGHHTTNMKEVIDLTRKLGFRKIIFSYPQIEMNSSYLAAKNIKELNGDAQFWEHIVNAILKEKRRNIHIEIFNTRVNLKELVSFYKKNSYLFECPAGKHQFYLDWNLDLYRCLNSNEKYGNIKELENMNFKYIPCSACTQQAHRDYASFYHAFKVVKDIEFTLKHLQIRKLINIIRSRKNRKSLNSLIEGYLGGFV